MATNRIGKGADIVRESDKNYQREKRRLNPFQKYEESKKYRENNREKVRAHDIVYRAIKRSILKKGKCIICGRIDTQGHHVDYSRPLEVIWLCPIHHKKRT